MLAFPANNFGKQEPGTDEEIKKFCESKYNVTFPLFSKVEVKGKNIHPVFKFLTTKGEFKGPIKWNFTKFLVNRKGEVVARFATKIKPQDKKLVAKIEASLKD